MPGQMFGVIAGDMFVMLGPMILFIIYMPKGILGAALDVLRRR